MESKTNYPIHKIPSHVLDQVPSDQRELIPQNKDISSKSYIASFENINHITVYQYKINEQWIIWDYNIGIVHLTGLWKAVGNAKADVVKLIASSPEIEKDIKRLKGGFLKVQGTWLNFNIARNLASKFCYPIRYALIPIFGVEFVDLCLRPGDRGYGMLRLNVTDEDLKKKRRRRKRKKRVIGKTNNVKCGRLSEPSSSSSPLTVKITTRNSFSSVSSTSPKSTTVSLSSASSSLTSISISSTSSSPSSSSSSPSLTSPSSSPTNSIAIPSTVSLSPIKAHIPLNSNYSTYAGSYSLFVHPSITTSQNSQAAQVPTSTHRAPARRRFSDQGFSNVLYAAQNIDKGNLKPRQKNRLSIESLLRATKFCEFEDGVKGIGYEHKHKHETKQVNELKETVVSGLPSVPRTAIAVEPISLEMISLNESFLRQSQNGRSNCNTKSRMSINGLIN